MIQWNVSDVKYQMLVKTRDSLSNSVSIVNDQKKTTDNLQKMMEISMSIEGLPAKMELLQPARRYIKGGVMGKATSSSTKPQDRHFFLFSSKRKFL
jgi:hypothetical protein